MRSTVYRRWPKAIAWCARLAVRAQETKPPARYSEASLIRALEANGVGRPSTYASIIETLNSRDYTVREKRQLVPTPLGLEVSDLLVGKLEHLFDVGFTARMEESLDRIEEGGVEWTVMMGDFFGQFKQWMEQAKEPPADTGKVTAVLGLLEHVAAWGPAVRAVNAPTATSVSWRRSRSSLKPARKQFPTNSFPRWSRSRSAIASRSRRPARH
jgi:hypothetical protein